MGENTAIQWCDHTFNAWEGCTKISPACDNCYAAERAARYKTVKWGGPRRLMSAQAWSKPRRWQNAHEEFYRIFKRRQRVFCASLADVFDNQIDPQWRVDLWDLIRSCPDLDWLLLTKRPQNIEKMKPEFWDEIKGRIWLGTTVENQEVADRNIKHLLKHDSAVRFLSCEPLLENIDLRGALLSSRCCNKPIDAYDSRGEVYADCCGNPEWIADSLLNWVIVGGESGILARPMKVEWARSIRDQCAAAGVPFLFKQWGEYKPTIGIKSPGNPVMIKVGKKAAGRTLDGRIHDDFPAVALSAKT